MIRLYCDYCNFNKIYEKVEDVNLLEHKRLPITKTLPTIEKGKKVPSKQKILPKQFKCPNCGRLIRPFKLEEKKDENFNK